MQSIAISSGTLSLTEGQFNTAGDELGLAKIAEYFVDLTAVAAADAASLAGDDHVSALSVDDTASDIQSSLDALNSNTQVVSIIISDNAALAMTAYAATHDSRAIGLLQNQGGGAVSLTVSDTAANVTLYFDQLAAESNISSIVISDSAPLTLSGAQIADSSTIAKLSNVDASGVVIDVDDTAANISASLGSLEANIDNLGYVSQVTISDNASITVSLAQLATDSDRSRPVAERQQQCGQPDRRGHGAEHSRQFGFARPEQRGQPGSHLRQRPAALDGDAVSERHGPVQQARQCRRLALCRRHRRQRNQHCEVRWIRSPTMRTSRASPFPGMDRWTSTSPRSAATPPRSPRLTTRRTRAPRPTRSPSPTPRRPSPLRSTRSRATPHVTAIVVSDSSTHEVTLSVVSALADTGAEGELYLADATTHAHVAVSDAAGAIASAFDTLEGDAVVDKITVASGGARSDQCRAIHRRRHRYW